MIQVFSHFLKYFPLVSYCFTCLLWVCLGVFHGVFPLAAELVRPSGLLFGCTPGIYVTCTRGIHSTCWNPFVHIASVTIYFPRLVLISYIYHKGSFVIEYRKYHQIGNITHEPLFRVMSWNDGMCCMFHYFVMTITITIIHGMTRGTTTSLWVIGKFSYTRVEKY